MNEMVRAQQDNSLETPAGGDPLGQLYAALAKAQMEFADIPKNALVEIRTRAGGSYGFKYANLDAIFAATRPALSKHGLAIVHTMRLHPEDKSKVLLQARLLHGAGASLDSEIAIASPGGDPKDFGSLVTYMRRYTVAALLGVVADQDNDGAEASGDHVVRHEAQPLASRPLPPQPQRQSQPQPQPQPQRQSQPQPNGKPDTLEFLWPNGTVDLARASNNAPVTVVWLRWLSEVLEGARDADGLKAWWERAGKHISAVQQHYPETAAAAARAYTNRFGELDDSFPAGKPSKSLETA